MWVLLLHETGLCNSSSSSTLALHLHDSTRKSSNDDATDFEKCVVVSDRKAMSVGLFTTLALAEKFQQLGQNVFTDIHDSQRMDLNYFGDPLTFPVVVLILNC